MTTYAERYDASMMANAAYLNFQKVLSPGGTPLSPNDLELRLKAPDDRGNIRFSPVRIQLDAARLPFAARRSQRTFRGWANCEPRCTG